MSNQARSLLACLLTFALTRLGFWYFKFNPLRDLPFWKGALLDFALWGLLWAILYPLLARLFRPGVPRS